jgi:hypothetical protein
MNIIHSAFHGSEEAVISDVLLTLLHFFLYLSLYWGHVLATTAAFDLFIITCARVLTSASYLTSNRYLNRR